LSPVSDLQVGFGLAFATVCQGDGSEARERLIGKLEELAKGVSEPGR
jgi:hypothetical protein